MTRRVSAPNNADDGDARVSLLSVALIACALTAVFVLALLALWGR